MKGTITSLFILASISTMAQLNYDGQGVIYSSNGNVGIGLNAPAGRLHLRDSPYWLNHNYGAALVIDGPHNNAIAILDGGNSNPLALANAGGNFVIAKMPALGNTSQSPGHLLTIQSSGNTGIGTITPGGRLHLYDAPYWSTHNYGASLVIDGPHNNAIAILDAGSANPIALANLGGNFTISKMPALGNTTTNPSPLVTVKPDGNVGIGTIDPDAKLTVKGDIHTQEVRIDMDGPLQGPDYVFEKDYNLLPLAELEAYINQNKHLPEVPSAKEMEANGLNLKEMNLLLLRKVEELTLHLIEQSKKIENQQIIIMKQSEKINKMEKILNQK